MPDNAASVAQRHASAIQFAGDASLYAKVATVLEKAIREEREGVLEELVRLADEFGEDDGRGEVYYRDALKRLLKRWEHTPDE